MKGCALILRRGTALRTIILLCVYEVVCGVFACTGNRWRKSQLFKPAVAESVCVLALEHDYSWTLLTSIQLLKCMFKSDIQ